MSGAMLTGRLKPKPENKIRETKKNHASSYSVQTAATYIFVPDLELAEYTKRQTDLSSFPSIPAWFIGQLERNFAGIYVKLGKDRLRSYLILLRIIRILATIAVFTDLSCWSCDNKQTFLPAPEKVRID